MRKITEQFGTAVLTFALCGAIVDAANAPQRRRQSTSRPREAAKVRSAPANLPLPCGDVIAFQILLDRQGISPGQITGVSGPNLTHAIAAFQQSRNIPVTSQADCATWRALGGDTTPVLDTYVITPDDLKGPFARTIPRDMMEQATLPALDYRSPVEKLAERFHIAPALLDEINGGSRLAPGEMIQVPAVQPFDVDAKPVFDPAAKDITVQVTRDESAVRATHADGSLAFFAPVTTGSEHDPLPAGDYAVTSVDWHPPFHYNPELFWDAKADHSKATIKPGPNNPVGVVWIGVSRAHYGMHGTPEPGNIGRTESHGCVRLTNWDAARLAALVKPGTPVLFR